MTVARLAISNLAWDPAEDEAVAAVLRDAGFGGVEIAPTMRWENPLDAPGAEVEDYKAWWAARRLSIVALQSLLYGRDDLQMFGTEAQRQAFIDHLGGMAAFARTLGASVLVFGSPKNRQRGELPADEAGEIAVEVLRRVGALMESHGVRLCIEPNPPEYDCDFINTTAEAVALVGRINRPGIAVQGDLGAMTMVGDSLGPTLRGAAPVLAHFHASEPRLTLPGTGGADHPAAARALYDIGYKGWISIEMSRGEGTRLEAVTKSIRFVRAIYQRVAR